MPKCTPNVPYLNILCTFRVLSWGTTGAVYNIPVRLFVPENYPDGAPACFVVPTDDMLVKPGRWVEQNGRVVVPQLTSWLPQVRGAMENRPYPST